MKTTLPTLLLLLALSLFGTVFAQGSERIYLEEPFTFQGATDLPDGKFCFVKHGEATYDISIADPSGDIVTNIPLFELFFTEIEAFIIYDFSEFIVNDDGSVTVILGVNNSDYNATLVFWVNFDPVTAAINWTNTVDVSEADGSSYYFRNILLQDADGYYIAANRRGANNYSRPTIIRTDLLGNIEAIDSYLYPEVYEDEQGYEDGNAILKAAALHPDGDVMLLGESRAGRDYFSKVSLDGTMIYADSFDINGLNLTEYGLSSGQLFMDDLLVADNGDMIVSGHIGLAATFNIGLVFRSDENGAVVWAQEFGDPVTRVRDMKQLDNGDVLVLSHQWRGNGLDNGNGTRLIAYNADGELLYNSYITSPFFPGMSSFDVIPGEGVIISGSMFYFPGLPDVPNQTRGYIIRMDENGRLYDSHIQGYIFQDLDEDCSDLVETPLANWLVAFSNGQSHYVLTDENGFYERPINGGAYVTEIYSPNNYWSPCPLPLAITVPTEDTLRFNLPMQAVVECPNLWVDISAPLLRRCFPTAYTVSYSNMGTIDAVDAYVEVELDEFITYESATIPLAEQDGNLLRFELGEIGVGESATFEISVTVDCETTVLGQTHCTTAHIYPDSICEVNELWSGASLEVMASCQGDSLDFTLTNVGTAPMTIDVNYLVIEDQVILLQGNEPPLSPAESIDFRINADGSTYRMEAEQEPNHPGSNNPTVTVEGCGSPPDEMSLGFVTQYWENDGDNFVSIDCQQNIGAYDPNDKRANPEGYGEDHFIDANEPLEYHIRFQNTGTDTAFRVVVRDQLMPELDITTLTVGAASHPYELSIEDNRSLVFTFNDILLVDSFTNEPLSHGFVKFRIDQMPNLPIGTKINNQAGIYFDFNPPVYTNQTLHTIGEDYVTSVFVLPEESTGTTSLLDIFPNPFTENTRIQLKTAGIAHNTSLLLYDVAGRLVREEVFSDENLDFERQQLTAGVYFYHLQINGQLQEQGKLVIQ